MVMRLINSFFWMYMSPNAIWPFMEKTFIFQHIPVLPKSGVDLYFDWETVDHRLSLSPNSKRLARIIIPSHLIISPLVVLFSPFLTNCWEVYSVIHMSWLVGKRRRKWSRREKLFPSLRPGVRLLPMVVLRNHWRNGLGPLMFCLTP